MGFGDLLKKAKEKAGELSTAAGNLSGEINDKLQQSREEAIKREAEQKKQEAQAQEKAKQEEIAKVLEPTCEKGDCLWYKSRFYFTCPADCECERKKFTKKDWGGEVENAFWPYMKRLEKAGISDKKEIYEDFMQEFLPQYGKGNWALAENIVSFGFEREDNPLIDIMFAISKMDKKSNIIKKIEYLRNNLRFKEVDGRSILEHEVFKKESLYDMSYEDFEYTAKVLHNVIDRDRLYEFFIDISDISIEQLYDENGELKPAGIGGPQAGFYGDTIYNTVEMWAGENGENDRG